MNEGAIWRSSLLWKLDFKANLFGHSIKVDNTRSLTRLRKAVIEFTMTTKKKWIASIAVLGSITIGIIGMSFFPRTTIEGADSFDPAVLVSVREVVRKKRVGRIINAVRQSEFGQAKTHLHELLVARHLSIRSNSHAQVILAFSEDSSSQSHEWSYDLVKNTTGWEIIGYGYRGPIMKR